MNLVFFWKKVEGSPIQYVVIKNNKKIQYIQYIQTIYKENLFVGYFWLNFMMKINSTSIIFLYEFIHIYMINLSMINIVVIHNIIIEHNEKHKHNKDK